MGDLHMRAGMSFYFISMESFALNPIAELEKLPFYHRLAFGPANGLGRGEKQSGGGLSAFRTMLFLPEARKAVVGGQAQNGNVVAAVSTPPLQPVSLGI